MVIPLSTRLCKIGTKITIIYLPKADSSTFLRIVSFPCLPFVIEAKTEQLVDLKIILQEVV